MPNNKHYGKHTPFANADISPSREAELEAENTELKANFEGMSDSFEIAMSELSKQGVENARLKAKLEEARIVIHDLISPMLYQQVDSRAGIETYSPNATPESWHKAQAFLAGLDKEESCTPS